MMSNTMKFNYKLLPWENLIEFEGEQVESTLEFFEYHIIISYTYKTTNKSDGVYYYFVVNFKGDDKLYETSDEAKQAALIYLYQLLKRRLDMLKSIKIKPNERNDGKNKVDISGENR